MGILGRKGIVKSRLGHVHHSVCSLFVKLIGSVHIIFVVNQAGNSVV